VKGSLSKKEQLREDLTTLVSDYYEANSTKSFTNDIEDEHCRKHILIVCLLLLMQLWKT